MNKLKISRSSYRPSSAPDGRDNYLDLLSCFINKEMSPLTGYSQE